MSVNIYFAGSIRGGRQDVHLYFQIIEELKTKYGTVLTEFVGDKTVTDAGNLNEKEIHDSDLVMIEDCQYLVAEVTQPSLGVGYEIGRAVAMGKKVLCLFRPENGKKLSVMIGGAQNGKSFVVKEYSDINQAKDILKNYFVNNS